jgi:hypothetical protein
MQRKKRHFFRNIILTAFFSCLMLPSVQASKPLWTFVPQTPTDITVVKGSGAQVIYTVNNQSSRPKTLVMKLIAGISQSAPCQLPAKGSCTLTLNVNGATLQGDVVGGPVLCQQGNDLQCYQPSSTNILRIRLIEQPPVQQFTVTPSAGANGSISPTTAQVVNAGSSLTFTAKPNTGFGVNQWLLDGNVVQTGGTTFQLNNIQANHAIQVTFGQTTLSPSAQVMALSIADTGTNAALTGNPRTVSIANNGTEAATGVHVGTSGFPNGTTASDNCPATLAAGASCEITIMPGSVASSDNSNNACTTGTVPEPAVVSVTASNAPQVDIDVLVLGYGCIYQSGFIFAVDDSISANPRIGGKVVSLEDQKPRAPDGIVWDADTHCTPCMQQTNAWDFNYGDNLASVPGSTNPSGGGTDGPGNTWLISDILNGHNGNTNNPANYAAGVCISYAGGGHTDWYLPAICDMGIGGNCPSGQQQNIVENLSILLSDLFNNPDTSCSIGSNCLAGNYWSSTEYSFDPQNGAWGLFFAAGGGNQFIGTKNFPTGVRCVRALTI